VDSCGPGHSPEKREADCSAAVSAANNARLSRLSRLVFSLRCRIKPYWIKAARCARRWSGVSAGLSLGGPPGARRASNPQAAQIKSALVRSVRPVASASVSHIQLTSPRRGCFRHRRSRFASLVLVVRPDYVVTGRQRRTRASPGLPSVVNAATGRRLAPWGERAVQLIAKITMADETGNRTVKGGSLGTSARRGGR